MLQIELFIISRSQCYGFYQRDVGFYEGQKKILASAHYHMPDILWQLNYHDKRYSYCTVYLYTVLNTIVKMKKILGISAYYHDSAAALVIDGTIVAAAQEERFTRKKHDPSFPANAAAYVLSEAGLSVLDLDAVAFYDKPYIKFERLLESYHAFAPAGLCSFLTAIPVWIKDKLFMRRNIWVDLEKIAGGKLKNKPLLLFPEHHLSHASSAFFPSPYTESAILTIDGVGEWATTTICHGKENTITKLRELTYPHSIGLLYSAFTAFCGFKVNSGEYKLMGLAPYGIVDSKEKQHFKNQILDHMVKIKPDGSIFLNMNYFDYAAGLKMYKHSKWHALLGIQERTPETEINQSYMNLALALQEITEEIVLRMARSAKELTGSAHLVMAGGVALNCVANGKLLSSNIFEKIWIQPAAGDAGGSVGAALTVHHIYYNKPRQSLPPEAVDHMQGCYIGPHFTTADAGNLKYKYLAQYKEYSDFKILCRSTARLISENHVVGWFQGRVEWGPRALGNRSILGDPRNPETQKKVNLKIKFREGFRPFAPSVLAEHAQSYFDLTEPSPYMLLVAPLHESVRKPEPAGYQKLEMYQRLYHIRSDIPAVTHVDYSARIQTVHKNTNPRYWQLITEFHDLTGIPLLVNTSFNVRGEPIVCTPEDAYRCFMRTEMDALVIGNLLFLKKDQPAWKDSTVWQEEFDPD